VSEIELEPASHVYVKEVVWFVTAVVESGS
jgi:hypothetical protein